MGKLVCEPDATVSFKERETVYSWVGIAFGSKRTYVDEADSKGRFDHKVDVVDGKRESGDPLHTLRFQKTEREALDFYEAAKGALFKTSKEWTAVRHTSQMSNNIFYGIKNSRDAKVKFIVTFFDYNGDKVIDGMAIFAEWCDKDDSSFVTITRPSMLAEFSTLSAAIFAGAASPPSPSPAAPATPAPPPEEDPWEKYK